MTHIPWRIGIEIELLAPLGKTRLDLAEAIGRYYQGSVQRYFHPQSEPSKVPGTPIFHSLTLGFEALDGQNQRIAQCVDDLTLQADLNRKAKPKPDWYRIVSDDERLLRLIEQQTDPALPLAGVMNPIAELFGTSTEAGEGGMVRVNDRSGASVAIAAPLPGERERPCELITSPLDSNHGQRIEELLTLARELQFQAPLEGATHIHFDAKAMQSANAIANFINLYSSYRDILKQLVGTNPHCIRLGPWPKELLDTVNTEDFHALSWPEAQEQLKALKLTKYCDVNLVNCIYDVADKNTIEVRILPVWLETAPVMAVASLFVALFELALAPVTIEFKAVQSCSLETAKAFLQELPLSECQLSNWLNIAEGAFDQTELRI